MEILSEIIKITKGIILFLVIVCTVGGGIYCIVRLVSYAIYRSKLQAYFNLKTEEGTNEKEGQEEKEKIIIQK